MDVLTQLPTCRDCGTSDRASIRRYETAWLCKDPYPCIERQRNRLRVENKQLWTALRVARDTINSALEDLERLREQLDLQQTAQTADK
jgi:hypothetical protein